MKKLRKWLQQHVRILSVCTGGAVFAGALLFWHLGRLTEDISKREALVNQHSSSLSAILHDPAGLPLNLTQWLTGMLPIHNSFLLRTPSVLFALITLLCATYIMRRWYGSRTALFGFFLFATSAWFLHVGRLATEDILYLWALPLLIVSHLLLHAHPKSKLALYFWLICNITLLYVPGMIWFLLLNVVWQRAEIFESLRSFKSWLGRFGLLAVSLLLLSPLAYGLIVGSTKAVGLEILGLPATVPQLQQAADSLRDAVLFIAVRGDAPSDVWLNHLPVLDAFLTVAFIAGAYFYSKHWRASRTRLLGSFMLLGIILAVAGGSVTVGLIVPLLYLVAAAGIAYLLHLWLVVFPRNPLARGFGIGLLSLAVVLSCLYGLRQYFVAWPHHPATQTTFGQHKIESSHR